MKHIIGALATLGVLAAALSIASAQTGGVSATRVDRFLSVGPGEPVQGLVWQGGLVLDGGADFGGVSGIGFLDAERVVMVSDEGWFISGRLRLDADGRPQSLDGVTIDPIRNSRGALIPRKFARDAEALAVVVREGRPVAVRVGFEGVARVADFDLADGRPGGAAREVPIPRWLGELRTNEAIESVCVAPPASPVAGSTVVITEGETTDDGAHAGWMIGRRDTGPISYRAGDVSVPTDCAFLPDGDLLVLERGVVFPSFVMRLVRVPAAEVRPGAELVGAVLLEARGGDIDNMEGLAVSQGPDGAARITIVSDNNYNSWQRNLLLQFSLPQ